MGPQKDYLGGECQLGGLSPEDFQGSFCIRCTQPECLRSVVGKSKFDARVQTWESRLFTNVPRMDPNDPRFAKLANAKFVSLDAPQQQTPTSSWEDPEEVGKTSIVVPSAVPKSPRSLPILNTPSKGPIMLEGQAPKPTVDAWDGGTKIVKPGAKIKLGG